MILGAVTTHDGDTEATEFAADHSIIIDDENFVALSAKRFDRPHAGRAKAKDEDMTGGRTVQVKASAKRVKAQEDLGDALLADERSESHGDESCHRQNLKTFCGNVSEGKAADAEKK
jgi:hypothetical protein